LAQEILIVGASGTGKSTSVEYLNPEETFIINVINKPLPFRGWKNNYKPFSKDNLKGNYYYTDNTKLIIEMMKYISDNMSHIKNIIIDDYQYTFGNEYMRRINETGFKKFSEIGQNTWSIVNTAKQLRDDIMIVFLTHSEIDLDANGNKITKAKTLGKLIDNVITLEGMFTIVLYTELTKTDKGMEYNFITQNDGSNTCKSPRGMFESVKIPNDLSLVRKCVEEYNN
jgi:hypothetical protein